MFTETPGLVPMCPGLTFQWIVLPMHLLLARSQLSQAIEIMALIIMHVISVDQSQLSQVIEIMAFIIIHVTSVAQSSFFWCVGRVV